MRTHLIRGVLAAAVLFVMAGPAAAQSVIRGRVVDQGGKPVEGAVVSIEATESNRRAQVKTNRNGEYMQIGLPSGRYNVTATKDNLKAAQQATISQGNPTELNFQLTPTSGLTPEQVKQMGRVDVAMIPIGGVFTMPPQTAREVLAQLKPKIAIPMHYRDNLYILETFLKDLAARKPGSDTLTVSKSSLPASTEIIVLRPKGAREYW